MKYWRKNPRKMHIYNARSFCHVLLQDSNQPISPMAVFMQLIYADLKMLISQQTNGNQHQNFNVDIFRHAYYLGFQDINKKILFAGSEASSVQQLQRRSANSKHNDEFYEQMNEDREMQQKVKLLLHLLGSQTYLQHIPPNCDVSCKSFASVYCDEYL